MARLTACLPLRLQKQTNRRETSFPGQALQWEDCCECQLILTLKQVDLSMLFHEPSLVEGCSTMSTPMFLSGEKRQAVYTLSLIGPEKRVIEINEVVDSISLNNYLYVNCPLSDVAILTTSRSKFSIELDEDLNDAAVSLLIENGLKKRFPAACEVWKCRTSKSRETAQKCMFEKKKRIDEELGKDKSLLEDSLGREVARRILKVCPCVLLS